MPAYQSSLPFEHGQPEALGVLLANLGTPDNPDTSSVRRYLAEFLWDPRVVEVARPLWWIILHGYILRVRPARSAQAYRQIWTDQGSPLLLYSEAIARELGNRLSNQCSGRVEVELGMSYGKPAIGTALEKLFAAGSQRIIVLPLYPQYSGTTTGSVFDAVSTILAKRRWVPEFRFINHYHDEPGYIEAIANSIRAHWQQNGRGEVLLFSFHGVPLQTLTDGDPYHCHCQKTARLVAESLELGAEEWKVAFQSRVGRGEWLRPYAEETFEQLGAAGIGKLDVVCPGFAADCLETLEEVALRYGELFAASGGGQLDYIPALNAGDDHIGFLADLVGRHLAGWPEAGELRAAEATTGSRQRAIAMGATQ